MPPSSWLVIRLVHVLPLFFNHVAVDNLPSTISTGVRTLELSHQGILQSQYSARRGMSRKL